MVFYNYMYQIQPEVQNFLSLPQFDQILKGVQVFYQGICELE